LAAVAAVLKAKQAAGGLFAACVFTWVGTLHPAASRAAEPNFDVQVLNAAAVNPTVRVDGFGKPIRLTCSIGIAASDTLGVWGEHLIAQADAAVYVARRLGRNQVQMAAPLAE
jgi:GGDEF domain-containing protein